MIKFFRKIRQKLLSENKFSKYLLYAIGEIVLVVIGILIALQINNLNEEKKNREFEKEILIQIQENINIDKLALKHIVNDFSKAITSSEKILQSDVSDKNKDSIKIWLGNIIMFDRFQPLTNAYEVIKSKGLDKISNKKLRFLLGKYYDDEASHMVKSTNDIELTFNDHWLPVLFDEMVEFEFKKSVELKDYKILLSPSKAQNILKLNRDNLASGINRLKSGIATIEKIQHLIEDEIK
ncbi:hypothetical protein KXJ69_03400 [Aureisphaera sp. CAU 1614]|uniref:Uncharacterized protein n=1 Tax=Halomarinibacterium sedimenti TaxID=2857106 RepID=A0A9X1FM56_9FLAO|nr:DUF6090 family protein [Halomarinibacterium sedimenti]MBW2937136.1 hypothetical protein [Halomarinibacterium sedimenti]